MGNNLNISINTLLSNVDIIFSAHLKCAECNTCDNCILDNARIDGHPIGCLKLRDLAMQSVVEVYSNKENNDG